MQPCNQIVHTHCLFGSKLSIANNFFSVSLSLSPTLPPPTLSRCYSIYIPTLRLICSTFIRSRNSSQINIFFINILDYYACVLIVFHLKCYLISFLRVNDISSFCECCCVHLSVSLVSCCCICCLTSNRCSLASEMSLSSSKVYFICKKEGENGREGEKKTFISNEREKRIENTQRKLGRTAYVYTCESAFTQHNVWEMCI